MVEADILDNGLAVVTDSMPGVRSLAIGVLVAAGPGDESAPEAGLAHLAEHLMFQGTAGRGAVDIARLMDSAGGYVGGFVTRDYTCYQATVLDDYRYHALDLLGDVLLNSVFPQIAVERQREAILCEIEAQRDVPGERVQALAREIAWPDHALGRPIAGSRESVAGLGRDEVIYFVHRHYTPDRMLVAAAGHVDHADFVAQVRDAFWRLLGEGPPSPAPAPPSRGGLAVREAAVAQAYLAVGLPAPPYADPDRYAAHVLARVLGGGVSSRLFRRVREERGLAYHLGCDVHAYRDAGLLLIEGSTLPEHLGAVLSLTLGEVSRLADGEEPPAADEVLRAVTQIRNQFLIASESPPARMSRLATQRFYFGRPLAAGEVLADLEAIDSGRLGAFAAARLPAGLARPAVAIVVPPGAGPAAHDAALRALADFSSPDPGGGRRPETFHPDPDPDPAPPRREPVAAGR